MVQILAVSLENRHKMLVDCRVMHGIGIWGIHEGWEETDAISRELCKRILGVARYTAKGTAVMELGQNAGSIWAMCCARRTEYYIRVEHHMNGVGIATGWVRFPAVHVFSFHHSSQTDSGPHPASYLVGTGGKVAGS
jgi:hypothetical protein